MVSDKDRMEIAIGLSVSDAILKYAKDGVSPDEVMRLYVNAVGVGLSVLWKDSSSSDIHKLCGRWGKAGFLESNLMDL